MLIPIFIPHGGCPERCHFCDQKVSGGEPVAARSISEEIEKHLASASASEGIEVAFYGGTFTALRQELQLRYLNEVLPYIESGKVSGIRIATRPDAIDFAWLKRLKEEYHLSAVELGVQSFDEKVLRSLGRTHSVESVFSSGAVIRSLNIALGIHLMIGCAFEDVNSIEKTVSETVRLKPDTVRIHPLLVIAGTELERMWRLKLFEPLPMEAAVERAADMVSTFEAEGIRIIRLGLQANEVLADTVLAGAYHPSFGEKVRSRLIRRRIDAELEKLHLNQPLKALSFEVSARFASQLKGNKKENLQWWKERFALTNLPETVVNEGLNESQIGIRYITGASQRGQIELF